MSSPGGNMRTPGIGLCAGKVFKAPLEEAIPAIGAAGFDAISPVWSADGALAATVALARDCGLSVQSLHCPYGKLSALWGRDAEAAGEALAELVRSLQDCAALEIPIAVCHCVSGFDFSGYDRDAGLRNFSVLAEEAAKLGIQLALENLQGEQYLQLLLNHFHDAPHVGFCWDSGHERCYCPTVPLLSEFGHRLLLTHLNSNLGITAADGSITSRDDVHYLPFDGAIRWEEPLRQLRGARRQEILNFEFKQLCKPYQKQNEAYAKMTVKEYLAEAYRQARQLADLYEAENAP